MKRLMMAAAALALLTTNTAHADDVTTAKGMMIASLYDRDCERLPGLEAMIRKVLAEIPASSMKVGMAQAREQYQSMVTAKFCETTKPVVAAALSAIR
jgi:hypothetical protein